MKAAIACLFLCLLSAAAFGRGAFEELRALKEGAPSKPVYDAGPASRGAMGENFAACDDKLRDRICEAIENAGEVLICARLLADAQIVRSLSNAARRGAFVVAILENKISVADYLAPEYLAKSSVPVYFPDRRIRIGNDFAVMDRKTAYILPAWDFSAGSCAFAVVCKGDSAAPYGQFVNILKNCEASEATKLEMPRSVTQVMERLK